MNVKEKIEKAIENINSLLLDFCEAVDCLQETLELLYSAIEENGPEEKEHEKIDRFVKDCIVFDISKYSFVKVQTIYERYLKYFGYTTEDAGKEALTRQKFTRYFTRNYKLLGYDIKRINENPELCFINIKLKGPKDGNG